MATATNPTGRGLLAADAALAALKAAGVFARKSPARGRGRCQTACYQVGDQYVNLARLRQLGAQALAAATPTPEPVATPTPEPVGLPPVAPAPVAPYCLAQAGPATPSPAVAAHRAAAAAGLPVSLAALARDLGQSLGLAAGGRVWGPATPLTGDPLEGLPWDPGTPAARARHADQGRRAAILSPVAQAIRGAGHTLPPAWASDGPILNGEVGPVSALAALPAAYLESAAAALAALPPVTQAQAQALELLRDALAR